MCKTKYILFSITFISILFSSCYTTRDKELLQTRSDLPVYDSVPYHEYTIRPNDEILIRVIAAKTDATKMLPNSMTSESAGGSSSSGGTTGGNNTGYRVYEDGTIDLPYIKGIYINGMTVEQAQQAVQTRINEFIPDAVVKLTLANKTFTMFGEIGNGQFFIYKDRMNIYQALAMSGLINRTGDRKHVKILRQMPDGKQVMKEFDIRSKSIINSEFYYIYPNDIIYVQRDPQSFWKTATTLTATFGFITSSFNFLATVLMFK